MLSLLESKKFKFKFQMNQNFGEFDQFIRNGCSALWDLCVDGQGDDGEKRENHFFNDQIP